MKILFDQNVPRPLARFLVGHHVNSLAELGWEKLTNGKLLQAAEENGYEVFITADKNIPYQQNLDGRTLAIIILPSGRWPALQAFGIDSIVESVESAEPGTCWKLSELV